jgi:hypothetical protein
MRITACVAAAVFLLGAGRANADERKASFAVIPGPFYNPNQGLGVMLMPLVMFHPSADDTVSPPSIAALMGQYSVLPPFSEASTNFSWAAGSATRLYLREDKWRLQLGAFYFDLFREFHGVGGNPSEGALFDYRQQGAVLFAQVMREVGVSHLYAGPIVGYTSYRSKTDDPNNQAALDAVGGGSEWKGAPIFGLAAQFDNRDNQYYPASGIDFNLRVNGSLKSGDEYGVLVPSFAQYFALSGEDRLILAYKIFGQFGFGDLPLSSYANYGSRGTTLGYTVGEYVDKMMMGGEAELRWQFWRRMGLEGGFGLGKVFESLDKFGPQPWLPGGWGSLTYKIMEQQDMRARTTVAVGNTGLTLYFAVGQNF